MSGSLGAERVFKAPVEVWCGGSARLVIELPWDAASFGGLCRASTGDEQPGDGDDLRVDRRLDGGVGGGDLGAVGATAPTGEH